MWSLVILITLIHELEHQDLVKMVQQILSCALDSTYKSHQMNMIALCRIKKNAPAESIQASFLCKCPS